MTFFKTANGRKNKRFGSSMALAIALASGTALTFGGFAEPVQAKKKAKKSRGNYSKGFIAVYQPVAEASQAEGADTNALKAKMPEIIGAIETPDDKLAAGQLAFNLGQASSDDALQRRGVDLMIDSGKADPAKVPVLLFASGQLAYKQKDYPAARQRLQAAADAGYNAVDPRPLIAETYFQDDDPTGGLNYLSAQISGMQAKGEAIPKEWLERGVSVAYRAEDPTNSRKFSLMLVSAYPDDSTWGDAIAIERNFYEYDKETTLDLMRLARRTNSMRIERDYVDYIDAADARRLPGEVADVIAEGLASGKLNTSDPFVADAKKQSATRISADKADLPALERDAKKAGANARTVMAAADALLSYGQPEKAEQIYLIAQDLPGVDKNRVMMRLGIAQFDQGKYGESQATFTQVTGPGQGIANLWSAYSKQKAGG